MVPSLRLLFCSGFDLKQEPSKCWYGNLAIEPWVGKNDDSIQEFCNYGY